MNSSKTQSLKFRPSIIDRLTDDDLKCSDQHYCMKNFNKEKMIESIRLNIEWFLYTTCSMVPKHYNPENITILDYGICDYFSVNIFDQQDKKWFSKMLCEKIAVFEPRLKNIHVKLVLHDELKKTFRIIITAVALFETVQEEIKFMTIIPDEMKTLEVIYDEKYE